MNIKLWGGSYNVSANKTVRGTIFLPHLNLEFGGQLHCYIQPSFLAFGGSAIRVALQGGVFTLVSASHSNYSRQGGLANQILMYMFARELQFG